MMKKLPKYSQKHRPDYNALRADIIAHADYYNQDTMFGNTELEIDYDWPYGLLNFHGLKCNSCKSCYTCANNLYPSEKRVTRCWLPKKLFPFSELELYIGNPRRMVCNCYDDGR